MHSAIPSAGMDWSASTESAFSGYTRSGPMTLSPSTRPTAMCSITNTPAVLRMVYLPVFTWRSSAVLHLAVRASRSGTLSFAQFVQTVERRRFITFRESRIVEYAIDKIFDGPLQRKDRLPDVEQFRSTFSDDMHAQQGFRIGIEDQFQPPGGVAANLAARNLPEIRDPYLVRHTLVGKLLLRFADK